MQIRMHLLHHLSNSKEYLHLNNLLIYLKFLNGRDRFNNNFAQESNIQDGILLHYQIFSTINVILVVLTTRPHVTPLFFFYFLPFFL